MDFSKFDSIFMTAIYRAQYFCAMHDWRVSYQEIADELNRLTRKNDGSKKNRDGNFWYDVKIRVLFRSLGWDKRIEARKQHEADQPNWT